MDFRLYNDRDKIFIYISYYLKNAIDQFIMNHSSFEYTALHCFSILYDEYYLFIIFFIFPWLMIIVPFCSFCRSLCFSLFFFFFIIFGFGFYSFYFSKMNNWEKWNYFIQYYWNKLGNKKVFISSEKRKMNKIKSYWFYLKMIFSVHW